MIDENLYSVVRNLTGRTGYTWNRLFDVVSQIRGLMLGHLQARLQEETNLQELYDCLVFDRVPVFHRQHWRQIVVREAEMTSNLIQYGAGGKYADGQWRYGQIDDTARYITLPDDIRDVKFIFDRPYSTGRVYTNGVEFTFDESQRLFWYVDPFNDPANTAVTRYDDGGRYLQLWAHIVEEDWLYLYRHLGYLLRLRMESGETYKSIATALAKIYTACPSIGMFSQFMGAMLSAPMAATNEVVEAVVGGYDRYVVTDRAAYFVPPGAEITAAVGDKLAPGEGMTDLLRITELGYAIPDSSTVPIVVGGRGAMRGNYRGELIFQNTPVPVTYVDGQLRFPIIGAAADVTEFWRNFDAEGGTAALRGSVSPDGTINPGKVMLECLSGYGMVIHMKSVPLSAPPDMITAFLRRALDPDIVLLLHVDIPVVEDRDTVVELDEEIQIIQIADVDEAIRTDVTESPISYDTPDC